MLEDVLLSKIVISTPKGMGASRGESRFLLEKLHVVTGQHVDSGDVLCQLGDYSTLWIEGEAFERDLETIRQAHDNAWPVTVAVEHHGAKPLILKNLKIRDIAPQIDAAAGSAGFYVELPNELRAIPAGDDEPTRSDWLFRPGQRVEIRVPGELMPNVLKGVEAYCHSARNAAIETAPRKIGVKRAKTGLSVARTPEAERADATSAADTR